MNRRQDKESDAKRRALGKDEFLSGEAIRQIEYRPLKFGDASEHRAITRARAFLEKNYPQNVSLAEVAAVAYLSRFHLSRIFKKHTGLSPHAYLESLRVSRAKELLRAGKPIIETAYALGFVDQSHLTRTFKKITGTTPGRFIEKGSAGNI